MVLVDVLQTKVEPVAFSHDLFQTWVASDFGTKYEKFAIQWRSCEQFDEAKCRYTFYVYLVSVVAVALTATRKRRPEFVRVIANFRQCALSEVKNEWNVHKDGFDEDVEEAASNLARLIFANPSESRGLTFEWSNQWLAGFGATEHNPIRLFQVAYYWKNTFIHLCRLFDKMKL